MSAFSEKGLLGELEDRLERMLEVHDEKCTR